MQNIQDDKRNPWFLDVDGTLVVHNYSPEEQEDVFLPGAVDFLRNTSESSVVILTTSRTENHMSGVMKKLSDFKGQKVAEAIITAKELISKFDIKQEELFNN